MSYMLGTSTGIPTINCELLFICDVKPEWHIFLIMILQLKYYNNDASNFFCLVPPNTFPLCLVPNPSPPFVVQLILDLSEQENCREIHKQKKLHKEHFQPSNYTLFFKKVAPKASTDLCFRKIGMKMLVPTKV